MSAVPREWFPVHLHETAIQYSDRISTAAVILAAFAIGIPLTTYFVEKAANSLKTLPQYRYLGFDHHTGITSILERVDAESPHLTNVRDGFVIQCLDSRGILYIKT